MPSAISRFLLSLVLLAACVPYAVAVGCYWIAKDDFYECDPESQNCLQMEPERQEVSNYISCMRWNSLSNITLKEVGLAQLYPGRLIGFAGEGSFQRCADMINANGQPTTDAQILARRTITETAWPEGIELYSHSVANDQFSCCESDWCNEGDLGLDFVGPNAGYLILSGPLRTLSVLVLVVVTATSIFLAMV